MSSIIDSLKNFSPEEKKDLKNFISFADTKKETLNVLKSSGKSRSTTDFPILEVYLEDTGHRPFVKLYEGVRCSYQKFIDLIEKKGSDLIFSKENAFQKDGKIILDTDMMIYRIQKGYYIEIELKFLDSNGWTNLDSSGSVDREQYIKTVSFNFLTPGKNSPLYSSELEDDIHKIAETTLTQATIENIPISMICRENSFYVKDFYITRDYTLNNSNLHYGDKFDEFHEALLERFKTEPKGLVLFHGDPGTGKTYYIRNLIKELSKIGKKIIYFPSNMISHLVSPDIMTFLSTFAMELAEDGKSCVLLLEDAEPLLVSRNGDGRSEGITNLLNLTDGLLNDMLSMQVIATFNTDLKDIDPALLRPERLIARKEFKKLSKEDANILATQLSLDKQFDKDVSLAEIYSTKKSKEILIHEYSVKETKKIGFK